VLVLAASPATASPCLYQHRESDSCSCTPAAPVHCSTPPQAAPRARLVCCPLSNPCRISVSLSVMPAARPHQSQLCQGGPRGDPQRG
jgi:hypothetical protein